MLASINKSSNSLNPLHFSTFFLSRLVPIDLAFQHVKQLAKQKYKQINKNERTKDIRKKAIVITSSFKLGLSKSYILELPIFDEIYRDYAERTHIDIDEPIITYVLHRWDGLIVSKLFALYLYRINLQHGSAYVNGSIDNELLEHFIILKARTSRVIIKINRAIMLSELFWHFEQDYIDNGTQAVLKHRIREIRGTNNIDFEDIPTIDEIVNQLYLLDNDNFDLIVNNISITFVEPGELLRIFDAELQAGLHPLWGALPPQGGSRSLYSCLYPYTGV